MSFKVTLVDANGENSTPYSSYTIDKEQIKEAFVGATGGLRRQEDNSLLISDSGIYRLENGQTYIVVVPRGRYTLPWLLTDRNGAFSYSYSEKNP
jgi:hypothetical protein